MKSTSKKTARVVDWMAGAVTAPPRPGERRARRPPPRRARGAALPTPRIGSRRSSPPRGAPAGADRSRGPGRTARTSAGSSAMLWLVSSSRGIDPIRNSRVSATSTGVGPSAPSCRTSVVDGLERALDVLRIDPGADHQRPFADGRIEGAERVVRHPLAFADVVGQPAAEAELPEDVVHHPVRVVARIEPADRGESVGDVGLRLARHGESRASAGPAERAGAARRPNLPARLSSRRARRPFDRWRPARRRRRRPRG